MMPELYTAVLNVILVTATDAYTLHICSNQ